MVVLMEVNHARAIEAPQGDGGSSYHVQRACRAQQVTLGILIEALIFRDGENGGDSLRNVALEILVYG